MFVEQAIFTSLQTRRQEGYQLAAASPGLTGDVAKELSQVGPAHDSLLVPEQGATSVNFHCLVSGDYCVSRTIADGEEYSGRGGPRVYTQMLVVPPAVFARFSHNPFAVIEAAAASGQMPVYEHPPETLETVRLVGRAALVNYLRLAELATDPGIETLLLFMQAMISSDRLAVRSATSLERVLHGVFCLLPLKWRTLFSFSTGLRFSARRPTRLIALPADTAEQRAAERASGARPWILSRSDASDAAQLQGWAALLQQLFAEHHTRLLPQLLTEAERFDAEAMSLDQVAEAMQRESPLPVG